MSRSRLFFEKFPPVDRADWIEEIEKELKGSRTADSLDWLPEPGLTIHPFYRREDIPGETYPLKRRSTGWRICDRIHLTRDLNLLDEIRAADVSGADSIELILPPASEDGEIDLSGLEGSTLPILFLGDFASIQSQLEPWLGRESMPPVSFLFDPLSRLVVDSPKELSQVFAAMAEQLSAAMGNESSIRLGAVDERPFVRAGADQLTSSACLLSVLACWIRSLAPLGVEANRVASELTIIVSVGTTILSEIARIRAIRHLVPQVVTSFENGDARAVLPEIHAVTSDTSLPSYDIQTNLIRTTTQALSAVLGGCDSLSVHPFDSARGYTGSEEARRRARNIQLILRDESYLGMVEDPIAGSYYIESVTNQMIDHIWSRFLEIEDTGGWIEAIRQGIPQDWIDEDRLRIQSDTERGDRKIVGLTAYPDKNDKAAKQSTGILENAFRAFDGIESLRSDIRVRLDKGEPVPVVHLVGTGTPVEKSYGIAFATHFISCGGFPISESSPASSRESALKDCLHADPSAVIVCGSVLDWEAKLAAFESVYRSSGGRAALLYASFDRPTPIGDDMESDRLIHAGSHLLKTLHRVRNLDAGDTEDSVEVTG